MSLFRLSRYPSKSWRFALALSWTPGLATAASLVPDIAPLLSERTNWCWAATDLMVIGHVYSINRLPAPVTTQCAIVSAVVPSPDCCADPTSCITTGHPTFRNYGIISDKKKGAVSFARIQSGINENRPIVSTWKYPGNNGSHLQVLVAWKYELSNSGVEIQYVGRNNPAPGKEAGFSWLSHSNYDSIPGHHTSDTNYYDIRLNGRP